MFNMSIRNLPEQVHDALRKRAEQNNRSLNAEVSAILAHAVMVSKTGGFGQQLRSRFADSLGTDLDLSRDKHSGKSAKFDE